HLRTGSAGGAVRDHQGGRPGARRPAHHRASRRRLAGRRVAHEVAGQGGLAPVQRGDRSRPYPPSGDRRRRAHHLWRRVPDHAWVPHGHPRLPSVDSAHALAVQALAAAPPRAPHDRDPLPPRAARLRRRGDGNRAAGTIGCAVPRATARPITAAPRVTELPLALSFFDTARDLSGTARAGMTLLFEGKAPTTLPEGPEIDRVGDGVLEARLRDELELRFTPVIEAAHLTGLSTTL